MAWPDFSFEVEAATHGFSPVCGIDEAGRGPWAGPVVAAAVILDPANIPRGLNDSKKLTPRHREEIFPAIMNSSRVGIGIIGAARIDEINILKGTYEAMDEALRALSILPALALVDGNRLPQLACPARAIAGGDGKSLSVAAASIIAKVTRDRLMCKLDQVFPGYGFAAHKGYGTAAHAAALARLGVCPEHRRSFAPIRELLAR